MIFRMRPAAAAALLGLCAVAAPALADDDHVGLVKNVTGHVQVMREAGAVEATPGLRLFIADRLVSDDGASAGVAFRDGTLLTLGGRSDVKVRDYLFDPKQSKYQFSVYLAKGSAIYSSGRIGKLSPESVKVDTPTATVGVRGTRFIVEAK